jgi:hypothetical protein
MTFFLKQLLPPINPAFEPDEIANDTIAASYRGISLPVLGKSYPFGGGLAGIEELENGIDHITAILRKNVYFHAIHANTVLRRRWRNNATRQGNDWYIIPRPLLRTATRETNEAPCG